MDRSKRSGGSWEQSCANTPQGLDWIAQECRKRRDETSFYLNCPKCGVGSGLHVSNNGFFAYGRCWVCGWLFHFRLWW